MSEPHTVRDYVEDLRGMVGEAKTESEILSKFENDIDLKE